jgi:hypothetical protein
MNYLRRHTKQQIIEALERATQEDEHRTWYWYSDPSDLGVPYWCLVIWYDDTSGNEYWFANNNVASVDFNVDGISEETDWDVARNKCLEYIRSM